MALKSFIGLAPAHFSESHASTLVRHLRGKIRRQWSKRGRTQVAPFLISNMRGLEIVEIVAVKKFRWFSPKKPFLFKKCFKIKMLGKT